MMGTNRRLIVGLSSEGRSTVVADARDVVDTVPLPGYRVQELWSQSTVPGDVHDEGVSAGALDIEPPSQGALVRVLTVQSLPLEAWVANPHGDGNRHVLTLVAGTIDLVLEDVETTLTPGDTVVLSGHVHDWRNTYGQPAVLLYTTFPLRPMREEQSARGRSAVNYGHES